MRYNMIASSIYEFKKFQVNDAVHYNELLDSLTPGKREEFIRTWHMKYKDKSFDEKIGYLENFILINMVEDNVERFVNNLINQIKSEIDFKYINDKEFLSIINKTINDIRIKKTGGDV